MRLSVDFITDGKFSQAGADVPVELVPPAVRKYEEGGDGEPEPMPAPVKLGTAQPRPQQEEPILA
jgi:hypothetical protein